MLLLIDNYDSFTYNLVQCFQMLDQIVTVYRNDAIGLDEIDELAPDRLVLSPGPCSPAEAGICVELIQRLSRRYFVYGRRYPLLGVCLGHQCIGAAFGGRIVKATKLVHGKTATVTHDGCGLFDGLQSPLNFTRYNSLTVDAESLPDCLTVTATDETGDIMGLRHERLPIEGVQFHPESILSEAGMGLFSRFLTMKAL